DGRGCRTVAGDVEGQVVVAIVPVDPAPQGTRAPGIQCDRPCNRVVAVTAIGREAEPAVQLTRVTHRDRIDPAAAIHTQTRRGPGRNRTGDGEAQGVVAVANRGAAAFVLILVVFAVAALHIGRHGTRTPVGQCDRGCDRVVAGAARGLDREG